MFNAAGQEIDLSGLLCLFDAEGPCANAVRDSQRTKTHDGTRRTLSIVWASAAVSGRLDRAADWYRSLMQDAGATVEAAAVGPRRETLRAEEPGAMTAPEPLEPTGGEARDEPPARSDRQLLR